MNANLYLKLGKIFVIYWIFLIIIFLYCKTIGVYLIRNKIKKLGKVQLEINLEKLESININNNKRFAYFECLVIIFIIYSSLQILFTIIYFQKDYDNIIFYSLMLAGAAIPTYFAFLIIKGWFKDLVKVYQKYL